VSPAAFLVIRFSIATLAGVILARFLATPVAAPALAEKELARSTWWGTALLVAATLGAFYTLQTISLARYSTVNAVFLTGTAVVWVPVVRLIVLRDGAPTVDTMAGILFCLGGFMALQGFQLGWPGVGDALAVAGALFLAVELVIISAVARRLPTARLVGWTNAYTGLTAVGLALAWAWVGFPVAPESQTWSGPGVLRSGSVAVVAILFTAIVATALAQLLANWSIGQAGPSGQPAISADQRAVVENLDGPLALLVGLLVFPWNVEPIEFRHIGFALLIAGVLTSELTLVSSLGRHVAAWLSRVRLAPGAPPVQIRNDEI
jgi:drug/metabolite transporter (DMT)-like permease